MTPAARAAEYRARGAWSDRRVGDLYATAASVDPARPAVVDPPNRFALDGLPAQRLDWRSLALLVDATMLELHAAGLRRDDVLLAQLPNVVEFVAVYLACARLGIVLSPVPMQFRRAELEPILGLTGARAFLTVVAFKDSRPAALATALAGGVQVLALGSDPPPGATAFAPRAAASVDDPDLADRADRLEREARVDADDVLTICWTSGTEGVPKGVPRSHNQWLAISHAHLEGARIQPGDRLLNPFPLVNMAAIGGCFLSWLHTAGTLLLHHPFELAVYLQQIAAERPQYAIAPPAVLTLLLQDERLLGGVDLSSLRCIGSGSAPLPPAMIRGYADRFGIEIVNLFGSNEGVSLCSGAREAPAPEQRARLFPRFGRPEFAWPQRISTLIETRLVDPDDGSEILAAGRAGEMEIRGPTVFDGYLGAPGLNAAAFTPDGWFRTGDLFEIDASGDGRYYRFVGRLRTLINRGGVKISPDELDAVLAEHPDVAEGTVVGSPDPVLGERVCAVVVPRPGRHVTLESIREHFLARGLAVFKSPERLRTVAQLPRNPVGKVIRAEVARLAVDGTA